MKGTDSVGNNEILFTINENFDVNRADVRQQLVKAAEVSAGCPDYCWPVGLAEDCKVKLTRKSKYARNHDIQKLVAITT